MKKVFKYATGEEIPEGAQYLSTQVEKRIYKRKSNYGLLYDEEKNEIVWHYFLVVVDNDGKPTGERADGGLTMSDVTPDFRCTCRIAPEVYARCFATSQKTIDKENKRIQIEAKEACKNCPVHGSISETVL